MRFLSALRSWLVHIHQSIVSKLRLVQGVCKSRIAAVLPEHFATRYVAESCGPGYGIHGQTIDEQFQQNFQTVC